MDRAKAAVGDFLGKAGHHHTTIDEQAAPAVTNERITPTRHEHVQTAVDKETHQDHYHTTVQPVQAKEVLPEKHQHRMGDVEHRHIEHDKADETRMRLEQERTQFRDTSVTHDTQHTQKVAPTVGGERVHHHVHETVQPVINKEVIQPEVVHTTVPIHETHHNAARHHDTQTLPTMTMDEFKKVGGSLTGHETRHSEREGCPDPSNIAGFSGAGGDEHYHEGYDHSNRDTVGGTGAGNDISRAEADLGHRGHGTHTGATSGATTGSTDGYGSTTGTGVSNSGGNYVGTGNPLGSTTRKGDGAYDDMSTTTKKPSLMDKLNPKKDADGDGKAGFMK